MGNFGSSPPDMSQVIVKVEFYKKVIFFGGAIGVVLEKLTDMKRIGVVVTTRKGKVYRIEYEPDTKTDQNYGELLRSGSNRIVLIPKEEMNNDVWVPEDFLKDITGDLTLKLLFDQVCRGKFSPEMSNEEISAHLISEVKQVAKQKWFENIPVQLTIMMLCMLSISVIIIIFYWKAFVILGLFVLLLMFGKSARLKLVGCLFLATTAYFYYYSSSASDNQYWRSVSTLHESDEQ